MKARVPKNAGVPGNMNAMLKQAQEMQENVAAKQAELDESTYAGSAGGGMVEVSVTGKHQLTSLSIKPEVIDPEDAEMLEDMIMLAVNDAMRNADETAERELGAVTEGMNIPGMPGMF